jgi:hypothetical protein
MLPNRLVHRLPPMIHEDVTGYLSRTAHRNHLHGMRAILDAIYGTHRTSITTRDLPVIADFCRLYQDEAFQLSGIEHRFPDGTRTWKIDGEWITKSTFISTRHVKVCPTCLAESPHIRGCWALAFYIACSTHGTYLIDQCPRCQRPLKWDRRDVMHCFCGFNFAEAAAQPASDSAVMFARLIAHRNQPLLDVQTSRLSRQEVERLAPLGIDALCKTMWFLGHCLSEPENCFAGHGRRQPSGTQADLIIDRAFGLLENWPNNFTAHLDSIAARLPPSSTVMKLEKLIAPVMNYFDAELLDGEFRFLQTAFEHHLLGIWSRYGMQHRIRRCERQLSLNFDDQPNS